MNREELLNFHKKFCEEMLITLSKKNADYTGFNKDAFVNFTAVEFLGIARTEQGFLTRMTDKLLRLTTFVKQGHLKVNDESVIDTLQDLANYSILLAAYLKGKPQ